MEQNYVRFNFYAYMATGLIVFPEKALCMEGLNTFYKFLNLIKQTYQAMVLSGLDPAAWWQGWRM